MEDLVFSNNNQALTNSLLVAQTFDKEHKNVLRDIRELIEGCAQNRADPLCMFAESTYINEQNGQSYPIYVMNRDGFALLAMGFTGKKALAFKVQFLQAFNRMQQQIESGFYGRQGDTDNSSRINLSYKELENLILLAVNKTKSGKITVTQKRKPKKKEDAGFALWYTNQYLRKPHASEEGVKITASLIYDHLRANGKIKPEDKKVNSRHFVRKLGLALSLSGFTRTQYRSTEFSNPRAPRYGWIVCFK